MADYYKGNYWLSQSEMETNASYIKPLLINAGWSINAICGILGNAQSESHLNPSIWQGLNENNMTGGYGFLQWTPATKYLDWCTENNYDSTTLETVVARIEYELAQGIQYGSTSTYPLSFQDFKTSTDTPYNLAMTWLYNYERPASLDQPWRGEQADAWKAYLGDTPNPWTNPYAVGDSFKVIKRYKDNPFPLSPLTDRVGQIFTVTSVAGLRLTGVSSSGKKINVYQRYVEKI